ncbi:MAG: carbonic anhydrase family protein [Deltaproteobacteria bacterium]|nr:carbonic anhydrase family protein [Deltaproteobacteria bacterium]MCL4873220.1 carbonic anhydrase family protein [bacterium]
MVSARKVLISAVVALGLSFPACLTAADKHGPHWAYEGEHGPEHWGHVSKEFQACSEGKTQSPIDLSNAAPEALPKIEFRYDSSRLNIVNNGHTVQVNYDGGSSIAVDGSEYKLVQFHFHTPSEHTVDGKSYGNEMHLVHKNDKGQLAVVGVLVEEGDENKAYSTIWSNLPAKAGEERSVEASINAGELIPSESGYFTYAGSLTTPPCSESVKWIVLKSPVQMSAAQIKEIRDIMNKNNRPVQPLNERVLKVSQ